MINIIDIFNNEIIKRKILNYLDNYNILELRKTCKFFKNIYDEKSIHKFQLSLELDYIGYYYYYNTLEKEKIFYHLKNLVCSMKKIKILYIEIVFDYDYISHSNTLNFIKDFLEIIFLNLNSEYLNELSILFSEFEACYLHEIDFVPFPPIKLFYNKDLYNIFNEKINKIKKLTISKNISFPLNFKNLINLIDLKIITKSCMFDVNGEESWDIIENFPNLQYLDIDYNPLKNVDKYDEYDIDYDEYDIDYDEYDRDYDEYDQDVNEENKDFEFKIPDILKLEKLKVLTIRSEYLDNNHFLDNLKKHKNLKTIYIINNKKYNNENLKKIKEMINIEIINKF